MFGKNKVNQEEIDGLRNRAELDDKLFACLEEQKETFSADIEEIDDSYRQAETAVGQVRENCREASALAEANAKVEAELIHSLGEYRDMVREAEERNASLRASLGELLNETERLVEDNKHFTTPSKYLSECSSGFRSQNLSYMENLSEMADCSKQMGVLALGAAIEAGRMGDPGKQFVAAAEDIRSLASSYDRALLGLRSKLEQSDRRIAELEEQVRHMVKLLRESNGAAAKLMKSCDSLAKRAEKDKTDGLSEKAESFRNQVTVLKNADEEIIKSEERNRMQLDDMSAEFAAQQKNRKELMDIMDPVFRHVVERKEIG